jgi:hypothetical protein
MGNHLRAKSAPPGTEIQGFVHYDLRLWRFVAEHHARKQISSDAFGEAEAKIEEQLALEGT